MSLPDLITDIIIEDTNIKEECVAAMGQSLVCQGKHGRRQTNSTKVLEKNDHKNKYNNKYFHPNGTTPHLQEEEKLLYMWKARSSCTSV